MIDKDTVKEKIKELLNENKRQTLTVCTLLIFMTLCAVIILITKDTVRRQKKTSDRQQELIIDQPLLIPSSPAVSSGYSTARKPENKWSEEETEKWFTVPDKDEIRKLGEANNAIITDLTGAAP